MPTSTCRNVARLAIAALTLAATAAGAETRYGPGVSDGEIRIGQTMPYSGPASAYGTAGRAQAAYFAMLNAQGGVNGRKITLISVDDGYSPPRTVEQVRRLVESDNVLLIFNPLGTAPNAAVQGYLNERGVPQLFVFSGAARFSDPNRFPWTMGWLPSYEVEARTAVDYLVKRRPDAKIAVLYQNDDLGKDYLHGIRQALGERAQMLIATASYELADPTVTSQIATLKASGADVFINVATARAAAQAIRTAYDIGWRPQQYVISASSSIGAVMVPAGLERAAGIISGAITRDPGDPGTQATAAHADYAAFMRAYYPKGDPADPANVVGYTIAQAFVAVLRQSGDDLTRENLMRQAANLRGLALPMLQPGLVVSTGPDDYRPLEAIRLVRLEGSHWRLVED